MICTRCKEAECETGESLCHTCLEATSVIPAPWVAPADQHGPGSPSEADHTSNGWDVAHGEEAGFTQG